MLESGYNRFSISSSSRGQWERTLQADINTAKQALNDALSLEIEKSHSHPVDFTIPIPQLHTQSNKALYASSTENIARLLKGWMENPAKSYSTPHYSSNSNSNSNSYTSSLSCEAFESLFDFDSAITSDHLSHSASPKPQVPLSVMLDSWLLHDDTALQGFDHEENGDLC